ncbi:MAG: hypothetical protein OHK0029_28460 [Armatimonadaceae bacterium]
MRDQPFERFLLEQPAFALSLAYLLIGIVGSFYYYRLFAEFGINVFEFAEISDFLLVVFRQPLIPAFSIGFGLIIYFLYRIHRFLRRYASVYDSLAARWLANVPSIRPYLLVMLAGVPFFVAWIIPLCAHRIAQDIRTGKTRAAHVFLNSDATERYAPWREMRLIGVTGRFVIFFDENEGTVIIPGESIRQIVLPREELPDTP